MSVLSGRDSDMYTRALFGAYARRVPAFLYVQDAGDGVVEFVGASRTPEQSAHPLRFGSGRTHQLVVGEVVVRPTRLLLATDVWRGHGLSGLIAESPDVEWLAGQPSSDLLMLDGRVR